MVEQSIATMILSQMMQLSGFFFSRIPDYKNVGRF